MSRIGNKEITVPAGVEVKQDQEIVTVKGPKGEISRPIASAISMTINGNEIKFSRPDDSNRNKALHGTTRANVANMIEGVSNGFKKNLELVGVGYRASKQGDKLVLTVGFSHPVEFAARDGLTVNVPDSTHISVEGISKQRVGDFAAEIRGVRPPEPYKGKGIRYEGEVVRRKEGKTGK
ncbi:50S ribosomal protein L6 [Oenococcus kitaharae]|uniref:Large ribosomal subunit protein uL6 n=1 Tax=Oenococcus kitaharae DSM 17330 TaxID=1045004 RepID=G9WFJ1_9LACO|nr:50S ribosomal protein L6 [Oenococcus kitaharae]EHN59148.1 LSU ribosomal protein L6p (L9e) [Oenococcus kitaharae DSM 17330]OEY81974.1 50S ribosomal protein L6 [Oenococcus kitaharae]OEY82345.1 50S ribosomal protein L6 [Oenococcus kitaharae]OEY82751.1 50S ribosomal protein L6 [Oenococcus kitaharae]